jgi:hypothetical protein
MRRKADSWINVTKLLEAIGLSRIRRRILRPYLRGDDYEVTVRGQYQGMALYYRVPESILSDAGTWLALPRAKSLAREEGYDTCFEPLFSLQSISDAPCETISLHLPSTHHKQRISLSKSSPNSSKTERVLGIKKTDSQSAAKMLKFANDGITDDERDSDIGATMTFAGTSAAPSCSYAQGPPQKRLRKLVTKAPPSPDSYSESELSVVSIRSTKNLREKIERRQTLHSSHSCIPSSGGTGFQPPIPPRAISDLVTPSEHGPLSIGGWKPVPLLKGIKSYERLSKPQDLQPLLKRFEMPNSGSTTTQDEFLPIEECIYLTKALDCKVYSASCSCKKDLGLTVTVDPWSWCLAED